MEEKSREEVIAERKRRKEEKLTKKKCPNKKNTSEESAKKNDSISLDKVKNELENLNISNSNQKPRADSSNIQLNIPKISPEVNVESCVKINDSSDQNTNKETTAASKVITKKDSKSQPSHSSEVKSKSQLKAERRAKQEAQRASKAQKIDEVKSADRTNLPSSTNKPETKTKTKRTSQTVGTVNAHKVKLFSHLYRNSSLEESKILAHSSSGIHKAVIKLGLQYKNKIIIGSNARVVALLNTLKQVISDYQTPAEKDFSRGFEVVLADLMMYLDNCRLSSVSMTNAVKYLKSHLTQLPNNISDHEAQGKLRVAIDDYMKEQIDMAGQAICLSVQKKISQDDVILTFGYSSLIERILIESFQAKIKFRVVIVDAGPLFEGKELLRRLVKYGLSCVYVLLSGLSYIMKDVDKVFLGAHALLTNGYVMSRAGSSQVALIAKSCNVPVLICCETHKFSERVQTDAFIHNELGDSEKLMNPKLWKSNKNLTPLTLMYEVTPSDLVTAVVTELAILPCTSVPVVLRVKPATSLP